VFATHKTLNTRTFGVRNQLLVGMGLFLLSAWLAWNVGEKIVAGDERSLLLGALIFAGVTVAAITLRNWRAGFCLFFFWMAFEDLVRKYMGNGLALFFGKDVFLALVYVAFFLDFRRRREKIFYPPFLVFLGLFFWLAVLQVFNQNSPHILYGLLGLKVDFYYVPLLVIGYALVRNETDLRKFLLMNALLAGFIAVLGMMQAILGNRFLNPVHLAPELEDLGSLTKYTPLSSQVFSLPDSVFVSSGRFAVYLLVALILLMGGAGYLVLGSQRGRRLVFVTIGILAGATMLAGNRGALAYAAATTIVLPLAFLWGAPDFQTRWLTRAIRRSFFAGVVVLSVIILLFPSDAGSRIAFYTETLNPSSSAYEVGFRAWDYPVRNLVAAFQQPNWVLGNGTGTVTLGRQYVAKLMGDRPPRVGVEEGYGNLILEMGCLAPFLWILWTMALLYFSWKVVRGLRGTRFFPVAFAIFWYALLLLYPITFASLSTYQDYICNIYLWLLVGILFRLQRISEVTVPAERL
jgi:hypothetical protein